MPDQPPESDRPLDPQKLLRIASLAREVLEEARRLDLEDTTAAQLAALHKRVTEQLKSALPQSLFEELEAIHLDLEFEDGATPAEVRIAYTGLIGWLGGLFQGLQAAVQTQAIAQLGKAVPPESNGESAEKPKPKGEGYL